MLPPMDASVRLEDPLDPMVQGLGPFELFDEDINAREMVDRTSVQRAARMMKLPGLVCGILFLVAVAVVSLGRQAGDMEPAARRAELPGKDGATLQNLKVSAPVDRGGLQTTTRSRGELLRSTSSSSSSRTTHGSQQAMTRMATTTPQRSSTPSAGCAPSQWAKFRQCSSSDEGVTASRCRQWPLAGASSAPRITRVLYINLDRDHRRKQWMEEQVARLQGPNVTAERMSAVDIRQAQRDPAFEGVRQRGFSSIAYPNVTGKWGVAGCTFSHLAILRRLREHAQEQLLRNEVWLVLEDDAILPPELLSQWESLWPWLPEDWDVARLGWFGASTCTARVNDRIDLALWADPPPSGPCSYCGSHAYVVNPASVDKVVQRLEGSKLMHVDCLLGARTPPLEDPALLPGLRVYAVRPALVLQNEDFPSDRV